MMKFIEPQNMKKFFNSFIFIFFLLSAAAISSNAQKLATDDGQIFEISIKPDKEIIMLGEPVFFTLEIKNFSAQELCISIGGDYRNEYGRADSYKITVTKSDGTPVPQPEVKLWMGGLMGCGKIPANGSYIEKFFLPHWATFESEGDYTINLWKTLSIGAFSSNKKSQVKADATTKIRLVPFDRAKMDEIIDALGKEILENKPFDTEYSAQALASFKDKRVIKYFASALVKFGNSDDWDDEAITRRSASVLAHFNEDEAISALEKMMNSSFQNTRFYVADALEDSEHPKALELLLKMQTDEYWFVRLRVAQRLSRENSTETRNLLRKMLKDKDENVRKAAQYSLRIREQK